MTEIKTEQKEKQQPIDIETKEIELPKLDLTQYIGTKALIESTLVYEGKHGLYVKLETNVIDTIGEGESKIELRASKVFGLQKDETGQVGWGKDTKLGLYLAKMNVKHFNELKEREIILQTRTVENNDFLTF